MQRWWVGWIRGRLDFKHVSSLAIWLVLSFRALRIPREEGFVGVTSVSDFIRISKRASFIRPRDIYSSGISKKEILSAKI
jgi:hypothetical protein